MTTIGRYTAADSERELVLIAGARGARLLVDRRAADAGDARLLAHLSSDEPDANAVLVCREYLAGPSRSARPLRPADLTAMPDGLRDQQPGRPFVPRVLRDASGRGYALRAILGFN